MEIARERKMPTANEQDKIIIIIIMIIEKKSLVCNWFGFRLLNYIRDEFQNTVYVSKEYIEIII